MAGDLGDAARKARRAAFQAVLKKIRDGKKLTAADYKLLDDVERDADRERVAAAEKPAAPEPGAPNHGSTLEEDLAEWTLRDGLVRGIELRLSAVAATHCVSVEVAQKTLWRVQRELLTEYGFDGGKRTGRLAGNEALALGWVRSIRQLSRMSQELELQIDDMKRRRRDGGTVDAEEFSSLVQSTRQLTERRDSLVWKVRELSVKEKKRAADERVGAGAPAVINITMADED